MSRIEWIECDDPERLAAAAAAGVRVEFRYGGLAWYTTSAVDVGDYDRAIKYGYVHRLPPRRPKPEPRVEPFKGRVIDAGGGEVRIVVDRDTMQYPHVGSRVEVLAEDGES